MSFEVGDSSLPVSAQDAANYEGAVPFLSKLIDECEAAMTRYCGEAWSVLAPSEPIVRNKFVRRPAAHDFTNQELPSLYVYVNRILSRRRIADAITVRRVLATLLWVMPPASTTAISQSRRMFWVRVDEALNAIVNPENAAVDTTTLAWGLPLKDKIRAWYVSLGNGEEADVEVGKGAEARSYPGYAWSFEIDVTSLYDFSDGPVSASCTTVNVNGGSKGDITLQTIHLPEGND